MSAVSNIRLKFAARVAAATYRAFFMLQLPPPFIRQMEAILGTDYPTFEAALNEAPPVSIRLNERKTPRDAALLPAARQTLPWHPQGRYLQERPVFTLDPLFHAGAYYVQEASSMFLYEAVRQVLPLLQTYEPLQALDLCAAPGGKSTLLYKLLPHPGLLVANEPIRSRLPALRENLEKWGAERIAVSAAEAEDFAAMGEYFDLILTDAPCSGEGMFRKDPDAANEWSPAHVTHCSARQRRILDGATQALRPGGILIYSTCTYNRTENEDNTRWLCEQYPLKALELDIPTDWQIEGDRYGYRFYPHRTEGEGFFIAVLQKEGEATPRKSPTGGFKQLTPLPKQQLPSLKSWIRSAERFHFYQTPSGEVRALPADAGEAFQFLDKFLKTKWFGFEAGSFKGKDFIPSHALALGPVSDEIPSVELSREQALVYLKKETFELPAGSPTGWILARYGGLPLGWIKALPNRMNNYLPPERRIRMDVKGA